MNWEELYRESTEEFERSLSELKIVIRKYDPISLIINLTTFYYFTSKSNVVPGHLEYFCGMLIDSKEYGKEKMISNDENVNVLNILKRLIDSWNDSNHARKVRGITNDGEFLKQITMASLGRTYVLDSGEVNVEYLSNQLKDLYEPIGDFIVQDFGFNINDVIEIINTIQEIYEIKLNDFNKSLYDNASNVIAEIEKHQEKLVSEKGIKLNILFDIFGKSDKTFMILTKEEIIKRNRNINESALSAFIQKFSCNIGAEILTPLKYPTDDNVFRERPIIKTDKGIIIPSIQLLYWAVTSVMEEEVIKNDQIKERYLDHKGKYLENQVELILKDTLPGAEFYNSLYYEIEENGEKKRCELDHLIIFDSNILLVESKSGRFNKPARRGAFHSFKRNVEENIEKAFEQADRTRRYILDKDIPIFTNKQGHTIYTMEDKRKFTNIFLINVTLENFGEIATNLHELNDIDAYKYDEYPWSVNIHDLRKITKIIEFPTQFIHYIHRRIKVNNRIDLPSKIKSFNELNLFYNYITENLYFDDQEEKKLLIIDNNGRGKINKIVMESLAEKPHELTTINRNKDFEEIIKGIEFYGKSGQFGFSNFILELMDLSSDARLELVSTFNRLKQESLVEENKDKIVEGILTTNGTKFKTEMGFHVISCDSKSLDVDNWYARAYLRLYEHKLQNFISIINYIDIKADTSFNYILFLSKDKPVEEDEELNELLKKIKPSSTLGLGKV